MHKGKYAPVKYVSRPEFTHTRPTAVRNAPVSRPAVTAQGRVGVPAVTSPARARAQRGCLIPRDLGASLFSEIDS